MASPRPWPNVPQGDQWLIELMEERFERTSLSPQQLRERAQELRQQAERADFWGSRDAALALADRYDEAAIARLSKR